MNLENGLKVYDYLSSRERAGKSVFAIAHELGLASNEVKHYLKGHKDCFVRVGDSDRYTINRFSGVNRSQLSLTLKKENSQEQEWYDGWYFWLFVLLFFFIIT